MPVTSLHPQYQERLEDWKDCRLFYLGEKAVKEQGNRFIPKPEDASDREYENYVNRAFFFPALERTVSGLVGAIDRKEPTAELPARIKYILNDADLNGSTLRQFSRRVLDETLVVGRCGILIDRKAGVDQAGVPNRGYLALYQAEDIINWGEDENQELQFVVLRERYYETDPKDMFRQVAKQRYRVLRFEEGRYVQEIFESKSANGELVYGSQGVMEITKAGAPLDYIPFVFCNIRSITTKVDKPPLLDLVLKNAEHLRVNADYANSLYFTGNPILWAQGVKRPVAKPGPKDGGEPPFKLSVGSSRALLLPKDASIGLLECQGHGVKPNSERAEAIKLEMAVLGARLLEPQRKAVESAETAQLRQSGEGATLTNLVVNAGEAIRKALEMLNSWEGGPDWMTSESGEVDFSLNDDFVEVTMDPQFLTALKDMLMNEVISWDTFIYNLAIGEILPPGRTADEERQLIESQPVMGSAGKAQEAMLALATNATQAPVGPPKDEDDKDEEDPRKNKDKDAEEKPAKGRKE